MTRLTDAWVTAPASRAVMQALGGQGYFVGGCVRNALLGAPVADIDIASPLTPDQVQPLLQAAGLKVIPTGLQHGTLTAVLDGVPVEVTSFRIDIDTDGRHARVTYTTDITLDAGRRDFTMNALYADADGALIDPLGGLPDLHARRVRFIGRAEDRITEDYLRILRFFRFHAWYGNDAIDADGLAACAALAEGLDGLARERVGWEFRKLLSAPDPGPAVAAMKASGILTRCLPGADPTALGPLIHLEQAAGHGADWLRRLLVLGMQDRTDALRLSRHEQAGLAAVRAALDDGGDWAARAYRHGATAARSAALIVAASTGSPPPEDLEAQLARGSTASFPLTARDLLDSGLEPGPALGRALAAAEARWIDSGFSLDKPALIAEAGH